MGVKILIFFIDLFSDGIDEMAQGKTCVFATILDVCFVFHFVQNFCANFSDTNQLRAFIRGKKFHKPDNEKITIHVFSYSKNIANFEAFTYQVISSSINLLVSRANGQDLSMNINFFDLLIATNFKQKNNKKYDNGVNSINHIMISNRIIQIFSNCTTRHVEIH